MPRYAAIALIALCSSGPAVAWAEECSDETCFLIQHIDKTELLSDFIERYPQSPHLDAAKRRLEALGATLQAGAFPPPRKIKTLRIAPDGAVLPSAPPHREPTNN